MKRFLYFSLFLFTSCYFEPEQEIEYFSQEVFTKLQFLDQQKLVVHDYTDERGDTLIYRIKGDKLYIGERGQCIIQETGYGFKLIEAYEEVSPNSYLSTSHMNLGLDTVAYQRLEMINGCNSFELIKCRYSGFPHVLGIDSMSISKDSIFQVNGQQIKIDAHKFQEISDKFRLLPIKDYLTFEKREAFDIPLAEMTLIYQDTCLGEMVEKVVVMGYDLPQGLKIINWCLLDLAKREMSL